MLSSKASSEPGRWRTSRTPYLKAIMDCLSPTSPVERVVFMKAAQLGATEMGSNWIGYVIHHAPGPMMAVWPTVEMAKRNSKQRIDPLIEESAILKELIAPARSRDSGNTILAKEFRGGVLVMTGANSAVGLRSMPVRYLFLDEVDGYPIDVDGEGSAVAWPRPAPAPLRAARFSSCRRQRLLASAPSSANTKPATSAATSCRVRTVGTGNGCASSNCAGSVTRNGNRPDTAAYVCESCEVPIPEHHKTWMLEHGEWRAMADVPARRPVSTCRACTARLVGVTGGKSPPHGRVPSARKPDRPPPSRPSRTLNSVKRGSRKAKRPTGSACWNAAKTTGWVPFRKVDCC
jgi:phage terminase large subunit GpA-like protein